MNLTKLPQPLFVGHRGYPARFPENTLASFEGAMQAGCDMIELDVTLTRDRQMVVIRDDTLDRTTSGRGAVRAHTLAAITRLDAGSWFDSRFASERVPELWEVIQLTVGRCMVNLEIKTSAFEADYPAVAYISNHGADQELVERFPTSIFSIPKHPMVSAFPCSLWSLLRTSWCVKTGCWMMGTSAMESCWGRPSGCRFRW